MQDTLIKETDLQRLKRIRMEKYKELLRDMDLINFRKKVLLESYNQFVLQLEMDIGRAKQNEIKKKEL